jgi:hypothetical protein
VRDLYEYGVAVAVKEEAMGQFSEVLHGGPVDAVEIARVRGVVMFEKPALRERLVRFWALLTLASAIATFGLYGDSAAAVIGAMIVAPLMLPIMGLAFAISIGDRRAIRSSLLGRLRRDRDRDRRRLPHRVADAKFVRPNERRTDHGTYHPAPD